MGSRKADSGDLGGFTIIEVVLVLAIAGLIFLMVFIALPALQRSQRDTQRRNDLARVATAITQYQTNNNGKLPGNGNVDASDDEDIIMGKDSRCTGKQKTESGEKDYDADTKNAACFIKNYLNSVNAAENEFVDPDGWYYGLNISTISGTGTTKSPSDFDHVIYIYTHASCDGESAIYSSNSRDYAILYKLEGSGTYCSDNGGNGAKGDSGTGTSGGSGSSNGTN